jgi:hypothetical protein
MHALVRGQARSLCRGGGRLLARAPSLTPALAALDCWDHEREADRRRRRQ